MSQIPVVDPSAYRMHAVRNGASARRARLRLAGYAAIMVALLVWAAGCGGGGGGEPAPAAPTRTISGRVIAPYQADPARHATRYDNLDLDGAPLANATVTIPGTTLSTTTDSMGFFSIPNVPAQSDLEIIAEKNGLRFRKGITGGTGDIYANINYQTTTASLYYAGAKASLPEYITIEWIEKAMADSSLDLYGAAGRYRDLIQDYGTAGASVPPEQDEQFTALLSPSRDNLPPYVVSISAGPKQVSSGEDITVTVQAYDPAGIQSVSAHFMLIIDNHMSSNTSVPIAYVSEILFDTISDSRTENGLNTVTLKKTIPNAFPAGNYMLGILDITDGEGNRITYTGLENQKDAANYLVSNTIAVQSAIIDSAPPEMISAAISQTALNSAAETVTIRIALKDNASPVTDAFVAFGKPGDSMHYASCNLAVDEANLTAQCNAAITGTELSHYPNGAYAIRWIDVRDQSGNRTTIQIDNMSFELNLPETEQVTPERAGIQTITLTSNPESTGVKADFLLEASAETTPSVALLIGRKADSGISCTDMTTVQGSTTWNASAGAWAFSGTAKYINDFVPYEAITVCMLKVFINSELVTWYTIGGSNENAVLDIRTLSGVNPIADTSAPEIISVAGLPQAVTVNQPFQITLSARDDVSGVKEASLHFKTGSPSQGYKYSHISANQFSHSGNGLWQSAIPIAFPEWVVSGSEWVLYQIAIEDFAGNSHRLDQTDITDLINASPKFTVN